MPSEEPRAETLIRAIEVDHWQIQRTMAAGKKTEADKRKLTRRCFDLAGRGIWTIRRLGVY